MAIRADPNIKGITIKQKETKLIQFADDTTAVIDVKGSAKHLIRLLSKFAKTFWPENKQRKKPRTLDWKR